MSRSLFPLSRLQNILLGALFLLIAASAIWWVIAKNGTAATVPGKGAGPGSGGPVSVTTTLVKRQDLPATVIANGSVVALQAVDIRPQVSSTVNVIHVAEGHSVGKGDLLFTLDSRTEEANLRKAEAQVVKSRSDYVNAERNLVRQRDLFTQKFISQAALDTAINQMDLLKGQLAVDEAAAEAARVAKTLTEIRAPFSGRTGAISVRVGSLVQPTGSPLVTISQIDPIGVSFALPERELPHVQRAMAKGDLPVSIELASVPNGVPPGKLIFFESTVDSASGTIAMKAAFANPQRVLWPGMFVNVSLSARTLSGALVVPVQAVQSGPERKFVFVVDTSGKATNQPVEVEVVQSGVAAIKGVAEGARVIVEGAQNVRPNSTVVEGGKNGSGKGGKPVGGDMAKGATDSSSVGEKYATPAK